MLHCVVVCRCLRPVEYFSNDPALIAGPGKHIYLLLHAISYPLANQFAAAFPMNAATCFTCATDNRWAGAAARGQPAAAAVSRPQQHPVAPTGWGAFA